MVDLERVVAIVQSVKNAKDMDQASAPIIALMEAANLQVSELQKELEATKGQRDLNFNNKKHAEKLFVEEREKKEVADRLVGELQNALDRDKTGLAGALAKIREEVKGRRWICEGRGPYTYDDDRYRQETGFALDAIEKLAADALAASGKLAHETLTEKRICTHPKEVGGLPATCLVCEDAAHHGLTGE